MERFAYDLSNALSEKIVVRRVSWGGSNKWLPFVFIVFFFHASWLLIADRSIKVIHIQDAVQAPLGWLLSKIYKRPYALVTHGLDITYEKFYYQNLILPFVRRADIVISNSSATQEEVIKRGVSSKKSRVITLGTADDYGKPRPNKGKLAKEIGISLTNREVLLTTGRLVKRKGVEWFVRKVLPEITKQLPNVIYLVAGDGAERDNIHVAIKQMNMQNNVAMLGRVDNETRSLLYQSCDVFVMPNIVVKGDMEGFGIVAHEAANAAVPVVASNLEGIADALVNGQNGTLLRTQDTVGFSSEITKILGMPVSERRKMGQKARLYTLKMYSWSRIADQYINVYKDLSKIS
tara:strand:+ start:9670 stop:10713 length:1044 start_codon:yes stop_codon:yes gene_type:complete